MKKLFYVILSILIVSCSYTSKDLNEAILTKDYLKVKKIIETGYKFKGDNNFIENAISIDDRNILELILDDENLDCSKISNNQLKYFLESENFDLLLKLTDKGFNMYTVIDKKYILPYWLFKNNRVSDIKKLVAKGLDFNFIAEFDNTSLFYYLFSKNDDEFVKYMIEHGADINSLNSMNDNAFGLALNAGRISLAKYILSIGGEVPLKINNYISPWEIISGFNSDDSLYFANYFWDLGLRLDDYPNDSSLIGASRFLNFAYAEWLINHDADINQYAEITERGPLDVTNRQYLEYSGNDEKERERLRLEGERMFALLWEYKVKVDNQDLDNP